MGLSWWHILLVLVVFVLLFGAGRISSLMGDIAQGLRSFKKGMAEDDGESRPEPKLVEHKRLAANRERRSAGAKSTKRGRKTA